MKKLSAFLAIAGVSLAASPVLAQENTAPKDTTKGVYVTAGVGGSWSSSPSANYTESGRVLGVPYTGTASGTANLGGGVAAEGGIGYDFGNSIRAEVTYVLNNFAIGDLPFSGNLTAAGTPYSFSGSVSPSGNLSTNSVFVSGYYDFKTKSKFTPYIGAGLGYTSVNLPTMPASLRVNGVSAATTVDGGSGSAFGYLAKIGVSYAVSKPADIFVEGIYQGNTGVTLSEDSYGPLNTFSARAGVRYRFGS